jgi:hypothetical protein
MFEAIENKRQPNEDFYDGYVVNAILDACYLSAKTRKWEPVQLEEWRGVAEKKTGKQYKSFDDNFYLIKEEVLPSGEKKVILKNKKTGTIEVR